MICPACNGKKYIEYEAGLITLECADCMGIGEIEGVVISEGTTTDVAVGGLVFQLTGIRTTEYSLEDLWRMAKEEAILHVETFPLAVLMPCGNVRIFEVQGILDLPIEDIACLCGDPNHYIVRFDDNRTERDNQSAGSGDTRKPKQPRKSKAAKKVRAKAS